jgi:acyl carrier protein
MSAPQKVTWTREAVEQKVIEIIAEKLDVDRDRVKLDSRFLTDLPMDSLDFVEIEMTCEDEFDVKVPEGARFQTVGEIVAHIMSQISDTKTD